MIFSRFAARACLLALLIFVSNSHAQSTPAPNNAAAMFPFALPPFDATQTATDVSWMNVMPAGANGFIKTSGEHFVDGKGDLVRFWGVNLNFNGVFPPKEQAPVIAARLAKFGFNAARIHHYEGYPAPNGIWKSFGIGSSRVKIPREFDPDQLDRFDFFMAELMKRGIYLDLNLHVGRKIQSGEGVMHAAALPDKDKGVNYYDEKLMQAQEEFARQILTHVNPYTGRSYADEPGVGAIEITNENSLLGMWLDGSFSKITEFYQAPLREKWNDWLKKKYDETTLRAAWTELDDPLDPFGLLAQPLPMGIVNPNAPDSRQAIGMAVLKRFVPKTDSGAKISVDLDPMGGPTLSGFVRPGLSILLQNLGGEKWGFQLNRDGLDLQNNQPYTLHFWARADSSRRISINLWKDKQPYNFLGFTGYADLTTEWREYSFVFRPIEPEANSVRLNFNFGEKTGTIQLGEMELKKGGRLAAPSNWTLKNGVPLIELRTTQVWNARRDFAQFLGEVEGAYVSRLKTFLRDDLKVKCPLWNSQAQFGGWGGLWREKDSDAIDVHAYWKHPTFGGNGWNDSNWKVENASMTAAPAIDPLSGFSFYRLKGKPFVMSEWNSGQPNDFGAESLLMISAYAAWQDWAGIYLFDYHSSGDYDRDYFSGYFSIDSQPAKMATAPAAALIFRRPQTAEWESGRGGEGEKSGARNSPPLAGGVRGGGDIAKSQNSSSPPLGDAAPATRETILKMPAEDLWLAVANSSGQPTPALVLPAWRDAGVARGAPLRGKAYVEFAPAAFPVANRVDRDPTGKFISDTRQIIWARTPGYFSLNAPQSKVATGFLGGYVLTLGEMKLNVPAAGNNFSTIALSSLDSKPVPESNSLLLTAVGKAENIGMGWNATRDSVGSNWGRGPTNIEGIAADIQILTDAKSAKVFALDNTGARVTQIPSTLRAGVLRFAIAPRWKTAWYEIAAESPNASAPDAVK
jgi:hypothetical protein